MLLNLSNPNFPFRLLFQHWKTESLYSKSSCSPLNTKSLIVTLFMVLVFYNLTAGSEGSELGEGLLARAPHTDE